MITLPIVGGLGNQLFILAFGLYLIHEQSEDVSFFVDRNRAGNQTHGQNVFVDLDWNAAKAIEPNWRQTPFAFRADEVLRNLGIRRLSPGPFGRLVSESFLINRDGKVKDGLGERLVCRGYFQSPTYYRAIRHRGLLESIEPRIRTSWYQDKLQEIRSNDVASLHLRLGDYRKKSVNRVLSKEYYLKAMENLESSTTFVFSDSIDAAREFLSDFENTRSLRFIDPPRESRAIESLSLLSQAGRLICSDSTFSWWAASTGNRSKEIYLPSRKWISQNAPQSSDDTMVRVIEA